MATAARRARRRDESRHDRRRSQLEPQSPQRCVSSRACVCAYPLGCRSCLAGPSLRWRSALLVGVPLVHFCRLASRLLRESRVALQLRANRSLRLCAWRLRSRGRRTAQPKAAATACGDATPDQHGHDRRRGGGHTQTAQTSTRPSHTHQPFSHTSPSYARSSSSCRTRSCAVCLRRRVFSARPSGARRQWR